MVPHNWYRIIPKNNDCYDDISFSMGQSWDLILPILIDLGYINRTSNSLNIIYTRFLNLRHELNENLDIHISDNHPRGEKVQYYMCLNKPTFSGPTKQNDAIKKGKFTHSNLRYLLREDRILRTNLQDQADIINKKIILIKREL